MHSYDQFYDYISKDPEKLREFLDYLTINVSEFFRNPVRWWHLKDVVIPELVDLRKSKKLRFLSAGAATGEEPYSLAMLANEANLDDSQPIDAWDIDVNALKKAMDGVYHQRQLVNVPEEWLPRYFEPKGKELYQIKDMLKRRVRFSVKDLIKDPFPEEWYDLILCRNVVIYFSPEAKSKLYRKFYTALRPGGYLMAGTTEHIFEYKEIGFISPGAFLYRRPM
jgi:chemotaxis protein methyltransferase CheR